MKITISELEGAALDWACVHVAGAAHTQLAIMSDDEARAILAAHTDGDTIEVPDELVEVKG